MSLLRNAILLIIRANNSLERVIVSSDLASTFSHVR